MPCYDVLSGTSSHPTLIIMKRLRRTKKRIPPDAPSNGPVEKLEVQSLAKHFPALEHEKLERLAAEISLIRFKRGDRIIVDQNSPADIFLVLKGAIAVTWQHDGRHQVLVTLLSPGEIFCVTSLLPEMAQGLKGYAFTNSLVGTINSKRLLDIVLGIVGAVVGGWLFNEFGHMGVTGLNLYSLLVAVVGAVIVLVVWHAIRRI